MAKAELHCHIEGAAAPALALAQAERYGVDLTGVVDETGYRWRDFSSFLAVYDRIASLFRTRDDFRLLASTYLRSIAEEGAIYSEFFVSTHHATASGVDPADYIEGLADGIAEARMAKGIEARMIAIGLRHLGPDKVGASASWIAANPHPLVTGFGMAGDERMYRAKDFTKAFDIARDAGLGITTHAGEFGGPQEVRESIEFLRPARIGHGVRSIEDPDLVKLIAQRAIVLETCPGSNVALGIFASFAEHPVPRLISAGCRITLNSDDPPHFHTSIGQEYRIARVHFGLNDAALETITRTAIEAAFIDGETRAHLLEKCTGEQLA